MAEGWGNAARRPRGVLGVVVRWAGAPCAAARVGHKRTGPRVQRAQGHDREHGQQQQRDYEERCDARIDAWRAGTKDYQTQYRWVPLEKIAPTTALAVIAAEDQQFPFHAGFDFQSIRKAIRANNNSKQLRGASTISQQVAKNLFLWSGRSYFRTGLERSLIPISEPTRPH